MDFAVRSVTASSVLSISLTIALGCAGEREQPKPLPKLTLPIESGGHMHCTDGSPVVAIDAEFLWLQGEILRPTALLASEGKVDRFEPLIDGLEAFKNDWCAKHPTETFDLATVVEADVGTDLRVIKKVVFAVHQAGFKSMCFAVRAADGAKSFFRARHEGPLGQDISQLPLSAFITIQEGGYDMRSGTITPEGTSNFGDATRLRQSLGTWRIENPSRTDVTINADDGVTYARLATAMSTAVAAGMDDVIVSTY